MRRGDQDEDPARVVAGSKLKPVMLRVQIHPRQSADNREVGNAVSLRRVRRYWKVRPVWSGFSDRMANRSLDGSKSGLSDGAATEVVEGNLQEGEMVITGQTSTSAQ